MAPGRARNGACTKLTNHRVRRSHWFPVHGDATSASTMRLRESHGSPWRAPVDASTGGGGGRRTGRQAHDLNPPTTGSAHVTVLLRHRQIEVEKTCTRIALDAASPTRHCRVALPQQRRAKTMTAQAFLALVINHFSPVSRSTASSRSTYVWLARRSLPWPRSVAASASHSPSLRIAATNSCCGLPPAIQTGRAARRLAPKLTATVRSRRAMALTSSKSWSRSPSLPASE